MSFWPNYPAWMRKQRPSVTILRLEEDLTKCRRELGLYKYTPQAYTVLWERVQELEAQSDDDDITIKSAIEKIAGLQEKLEAVVKTEWMPEPGEHWTCNFCGSVSPNPHKAPCV